MSRVIAIVALAWLAAACARHIPDRCVHNPAPASARSDNRPKHIQTVFVIVMENKDWSAVKGSASAPFINETLLPMASHAEQYFNPPGLHPSEPNYLWLEGGTNYGIADDDDPSSHGIPNHDHLVAQLEQLGVSWRAYEEDIPGTECPLRSQGRYAAKHDPFVFFDDVTDHGSASSPHCLAHVRPFSELAGDLQNGTVAAYNFITPNLCDDMHDSSGCSTNDEIRNGDTWLRDVVPQILASRAYQDGGAIFITWDEGGNGDGPIGMIVLSPFAKGNGYASGVRFTHSSTLRSLQEIFGVAPDLCDAASANDLSDLFSAFP